VNGGSRGVENKDVREVHVGMAPSITMYIR
jgi:hypothetical protein